MKRVMEKLRRDYRAVEGSLGDTMLALVVAKGYVSMLLRMEWLPISSIATIPN